MAQLTRIGQTGTLTLTDDEVDTLDGLEQRGDGTALQDYITSWLASKAQLVLTERFATLTPAQRAVIHATLRTATLERPR